MLKIGAFGSLFIATIYLESLIPAKCCIAPDIPQAIYNSGLTVVPVWPTWWELSIHPESTAALEAPISAPNLSANFFISSNPSAFFNPLPADTIILASIKFTSFFLWKNFYQSSSNHLFGKHWVDNL